MSAKKYLKGDILWNVFGGDLRNGYAKKVTALRRANGRVAVVAVDRDGRWVTVHMTQEKARRLAEQLVNAADQRHSPGDVEDRRMMNWAQGL